MHRRRSEVLSALARGEAHNPLRSVVRPPDTGHFLGLMPAYRGGGNPAYALKEVCIFPDNPARGLDAHQGSVLLHSAETGELMAVMNGSAITAIRTAAVSGLATKQLGRGFPEEITLFKSLGIAIEDLAAAQFLYQRAIEKCVGTRIDF